MRRPLTTSLICGLLLLLAGCGRDEQVILKQGGNNTPEASTAEALLLYVIVPVLLVLVIAALVWLPGMARGNRYRPGRGWSAPPVWFAGPPDPAAAVESAEVEDIGRGGASGNW